MTKPITFVILTLLISILGACQPLPQDVAGIEQIKQQLAAIESRLDELAQGADVSNLDARIATLEQKINAVEAAGDESVITRLEALEAHIGAVEEIAGHASPETKDATEARGQEQVFQVTMATYLLDTAGFHDMDERINAEGTIQPGDAGTVRRAHRVVTMTGWPEELKAKADQLADILEKYAEALSNDDVEAAKPLATEAHTVQHELAHAVETWLAGGSGEAGHGEEEHKHDHEG